MHRQTSAISRLFKCHSQEIPYPPNYIHNPSSCILSSPQDGQSKESRQKSFYIHLPLFNSGDINSFHIIYKLWECLLYQQQYKSPLTHGKKIWLWVYGTRVSLRRINGDRRVEWSNCFLWGAMSYPTTVRKTGKLCRCCNIRTQTCLKTAILSGRSWIQHYNCH